MALLSGKLLATKLMVGAAGAGVGAVSGVTVDALLPGEAMAVRFGAAILGSVSALILRPPEGSWMMFVRFWVGTFFGFLLSPYFYLLPYMGWAQVETFDAVAARTAISAFALFFGAQVVAEWLGNPQLQRNPPWTWRKK